MGNLEVRSLRLSRGIGRNRAAALVIALLAAFALLLAGAVAGFGGSAAAKHHKGHHHKGHHHKGHKGKGHKKGHKTKPYKGPKIDTTDADRCDFLDTSVCLQPFPNNAFTTKDSGTSTGLRINFDAASMPQNVHGVGIDPTEWNRNDGFSPGQAITLHIPGLDNQKAFQRSKIVSLTRPDRYDNKAQPVVVFNADTGERQPIFAEMDANPSDNADRNLIIRPLKNWDEGARYIVALRRLKTASGDKIPAPNAFKVYRDRLITKQDAVEARRKYFENKIFKPIKKFQTVHRHGLYMAWDFTVASEQNLSSRVLAMRDDAFHRLGDDNLADNVVQGDSPQFEVTNVTDNPDTGVLRRVEGSLTVPCYLDTNGCPPGAKFAYSGPDDMTPNFNPSFKETVPFRCDIPDSVVQGGNVVPARPAMYGHGLLGDKGEVSSGPQRDFGSGHDVMTCGVNWDGFSEDDLLPVILPSLSDVSKITAAFDRMQQGFVNFMMLGRAMVNPGGFNTDPAFQIDAGSGPEPVIDTRQLYYYGNSQGAIMGGALTALEPDVRHSELGVTGMNYSTLLRRSVDFDDYAKLPNLGLYDNYPDEGQRVLLLGLMQMLWDRGEADGYAEHMTTDPYPNTPTHAVLLHAAVGDHQVSNITAEVEARTVGAKVLQPALDPGRHWMQNPFFQIPSVSSFPDSGSTLVYWDGGPTGFMGTNGEGSKVAPVQNVPPRPENGYGGDPHSYPRKTPAAQQQMSDWMQPGMSGAIQSNCGGPCYSNGWTGP